MKKLKNIIFLSTLISTLWVSPIFGDTHFSQNDIDLISRVAIHESGNECKYGQQLVIDTILNRIDHPEFPDTVTSVVYQKNQYSCVHSKKFYKHTINKLIKTRKLVRKEIHNRKNNDVIFFRTKHYIYYGEPVFRVGHHYFSSLKWKEEIK